MCKMVAICMIPVVLFWTAGCVGVQYSGATRRIDTVLASKKPIDSAMDIKMGFHSGVAAALNPKGRIVKKQLEACLVEPPDALMTAGMSASFDIVSGTLVEEMMLEIAQGRSTVEEKNTVWSGTRTSYGWEQTASLRYSTILFLANRKSSRSVLSRFGLVAGAGGAYTCGDTLSDKWSPVLNLGAGYFMKNASLRIEWVLFPGGETVTNAVNLSFGVSF
jgi:hypothetical protein